MNQGKRITVGAVLWLSTFLAVGAVAQAGKPDPGAGATPVAVTAEQQAKIEGAWKDVQIANLRLQLIAEQIAGEIGNGTYYDYNQQRFFRRSAVAAKAAPTPAPPSPPAPAHAAPEK